MNILYLHPNSWNEYPILKNFCEMGHHVYVLEQSKKVKSFTLVLRDYFEERGDGIRTLWFNSHREWRKVLTFPFDRMIRNKFDGRNFFHYMAVIRRAVNFFDDADVIICSDGYSFASPAAVLKMLHLVKKPLVVSFIGGDILDRPEAEYGRRRTFFNNYLFKTVYKYSEVLRPVSPFLKNIMLKDGAEPDKIEACPSHLPDIEIIESISDIDEFRASSRRRLEALFGLPENPKIVVSVCGAYGKGSHLVADIMARLIERVENVSLIFVGPITDYVVSVKRKCKSLKITDRVFFTGRVPHKEVYRYLASADLHLSATLADGLNMVAAEAAAVGTATIITNMAGIKDWIHKYKCGMIVDAGDKDALERAVIAFFDMEKDELKILQGNCIKMSKEFYPDKVGERLIGIFERAQRKCL